MLDGVVRYGTEGVVLLMKIGIIGLGMVGEAVAFGFRRIGHEVIGYDTDLAKGGGSWESLLATEMVFICVPTPLKNFRCDTTIVADVVKRLRSSNYTNLVVIKSTVPPGTTEALATSGLWMAFCPEFLRERARFSDFVDNHELCIAGVDKFPEAATELIRKVHGALPKHFVVMRSCEAELAKYFVNCFNAYRVNFANAFYDVCKHLGTDYTVVQDAVCQRSGITPDYLMANQQTREFGGACLPKDAQAFASFVGELGLATGLFAQIVLENERVKQGLIQVRDLRKQRKLS